MRVKRLILKVLFIMCLGVCFGMAAHREHAKAEDLYCKYLSGNNTWSNDYISTSQPVYSYLVPVDSGYMRIQGNTSETGISIVYYDKKYNLLERKTVDTELPIFGGFTADDNAYYIVSGQENTEENNDKEVYRITKYDKNWKRLGSCGLYGANTTIPFRSGSCRMAIDGQYLIIRTSHQMYRSSDGKNHQANVTIEVDISSMNVTDSYTRVMNTSVGYVSHSFNQFIIVDDHALVSVDHGDAYPRSVCFMKYDNDVSDGYFQSYVMSGDVLSFRGSIGDNYTGASVGGFEMSDTGYLIAGNSIDQQGNDNSYSRNLFIAYVDKSLTTKKINWITDVNKDKESTTTPHLVKISDNRFIVLWGKKISAEGNTAFYGGEETKVYYTLVDGNGDVISETYSMDGELSDCKPIVSDGKVIWFTWKDKTEKFYEISVSDISKTKTKEICYEHDYEYVSTKNGKVYFKCKKCGEKKSGKVLNRFLLTWKKGKEGNYYSYRIPEDIQNGDELYFNLYVNDLEFTYNEFNEMVIESDDPKHCITDWKSGRVKFTAGGNYIVKAYPKYNPSAAEYYEFAVNPLPKKTKTSKLYKEMVAEPIGTDTSITIGSGAGFKTTISFRYRYRGDRVENAKYTRLSDKQLQIDSFSTFKDEVSIPDSIKYEENNYAVTVICENFLEGNDTVTTVKLGNKIKAISSNAFKNLKNIKKIEISAAKLKKVGKNAFKGIYKKAQIILTGTNSQCKKAKKLIVASGIGKNVKVVFKTK